MSRKFQNKSGSYLCYFDLFANLVSQLEFKKSPVQVHIIPTLNQLKASKQIWVVFGLFLFDFFL